MLIPDKYNFVQFRINDQIENEECTYHKTIKVAIFMHNDLVFPIYINLGPDLFRIGKKSYEFLFHPLPWIGHQTQFVCSTVYFGEHFLFFKDQA